jgi:hypothetical protein
MGMEPFNAASNQIFIVCAAVCAALLFRDWAKLQTKSRLVLLSLSTLIMLIGMGSAAFHFKPTHTTHAFDLIPIGLFILLALISLLKKGFKLSWPIIVAIASVWSCFTAVASTAPQFLAGSLVYVPTLLLLLCMAVVNPQYNRKLWAVFSFFGMGLLIRAIDLPLCDSFSMGTHWLWHVCTALAALQSYLLILHLCRTNDTNATASA